MSKLTTPALLDSVVKTTETLIKLKQVNVDGAQEALDKAAKVLYGISDKILAEVDALDLTTAEGLTVIQSGATPESTFFAEPTRQHSNTGSLQVGEPLFAGKTLKQLQGSMTEEVRQLALKISRNPPADPNVPVQGGLGEEAWRQQLIQYVTTNASYLR